MLISAVISILEDFGSLLPARTVTVKNGFILSEILILTVTYSIQFLFVTFTCVMPRCCSDTQFFPIKEENETRVEIDANSKYDNQELFGSFWLI